MDKYTATELAYKNGYEKGYAEAKAEIVYCKDCRSYNTKGCGKGFGWCEAWEQGRMDNHFCSSGKRAVKPNISENTMDALNKMGEKVHGG